MSNNIIDSQHNNEGLSSIYNDECRERRRQKMADKWKVQFITNNACGYSHIEGARLALEGGCKWIQLRMKDCEDEEIETTALIIKIHTEQYSSLTTRLRLH